MMHPLEKITYTLGQALRQNDILTLARIYTDNLSTPGFMMVFLGVLLKDGALYNHVVEDETKLTSAAVDLIALDPHYSLAANIVLNQSKLPVIAQRIFLNALSAAKAQSADALTLPNESLKDLSQGLVCALYWRQDYFENGALELVRMLPKAQASVVFKEVSASLYKGRAAIPAGLENDVQLNLISLMGSFKAIIEDDVVGNEVAYPVSQKGVIAAAGWLSNDPKALMVYLTQVIHHFQLDIFEGSPSVSDFIGKVAPGLRGELESLSFIDYVAVDIISHAPTKIEEDRETLDQFMI